MSSLDRPFSEQGIELFEEHLLSLQISPRLRIPFLLFLAKLPIERYYRILVCNKRKRKYANRKVFISCFLNTF